MAKKAAQPRARASKAKPKAAEPVADVVADQRPKTAPAPSTHMPARQIPGATQQHLDPDDLPANDRPAQDGQAIRVQAKAMCYVGDKLYRVGDVFDIPNEAAFSTTSMRRVSRHTPARTTSSNAALQRAKQGEPVNETAPEPGAAAADDVL